MYLLTILLCKSASFQKRDFSVAIQIFLVTDEDYDNVWTGKGSGICQPVCQRVVCFTAAITSKKKIPYAKVIVCLIDWMIAQYNIVAWCKLPNLNSSTLM